MPATTSKGYPYPVGTDRVADGDNAIQALAEKIDTALGVVAAGQVLITGTGTPQAATAVTFPAGRFTAIPLCFATGLTGVVGYVSVATTSGVTVAVKRTDDVNFSAVYTVNWLAIQI